MTEDKQIKQQLDRSCNMIDPKLEQRIASRVSLAKSGRSNSRKQWTYAFASVALVASLSIGLTNYQSLSEEEVAMYEDLELLIAEDELDFLETMDVSDWIIEPQEDTDA